MVMFDQKVKKMRHLSSTSPKDKFRAGTALSAPHHNQNAANQLCKSSRSQESVVPKSSKPAHEIFESTIVLEFMQWQTESKSGPGLNNHGNTCYLNSTIQCLLHTPAFTQVLLKKSSLALRGLASGNSQPNTVLHSYQSLVMDVWTRSTKKTLSPRCMVQNIRRVGKQFRPNRQEDAHEYLRQLLDCMHEEILKANHVKTSDGKIAETTLISQVFGGYLQNELKCPLCRYSSKTFNHFQDLSLEICGGITSVPTALNAFVKCEKLNSGNEWRCDGCKKKVQASKHLTINKTPNVLVIHLKRFAYGCSTGKINKKIEFGEFLDVPCSEEANSLFRYNLIGIIVHHGGSIHSGHYIAFVKAPNGLWYEMDDEDVAQVTPQYVMRQQAYILFYSKISPTKSLSVKPSSAAKVPVGLTVRAASSNEVKTSKMAVPNQLFFKKCQHVTKPAGRDESTIMHSVTSPMTGFCKPAGRDESTIMHSVTSPMTGFSKSTIMHSITSPMKGFCKPAGRDESTIMHSITSPMKGFSKPFATQTTCLSTNLSDSHILSSLCTVSAISPKILATPEEKVNNCFVPKEQGTFLNDVSEILKTEREQKKTYPIGKRLIGLIDLKKGGAYSPCYADGAFMRRRMSKAYNEGSFTSYSKFRLIGGRHRPSISCLKRRLHNLDDKTLLTKRNNTLLPSTVKHLSKKIRIAHDTE